MQENANSIGKVLFIGTNKNCWQFEYKWNSYKPYAKYGVGVDKMASKRNGSASILR